MRYRTIFAADADYVLRWLEQTSAPENIIGLQQRVVTALSSCPAYSEKPCGFCKGGPVANAASWLDGKPRPPAPCPRCGKTAREA